MPKVTVVIPTLKAGPSLLECLASLARQSYRDFDVTIVDNSGVGLVCAGEAGRLGARVLEPVKNLGFGAAINEAVRHTNAPYIATINDDAIAHEDWLGALVQAMDSHADAGSCASQVRLFGEDRLDSAGMLISRDGSSKQRGHGEPPSKYPKLEEVLCPSGSAAIYRRRMLDQTGSFDEKFFLYCEDTDLGLRAQWAGWKCYYVSGAVAEHHYSQTAGNASALKAYYVERNRMLVAAKNFPPGMLLRTPATACARYFWHVVSAFQGTGSAGRFRGENRGVLEMAYIVARAHIAVLGFVPRVLGQRRTIRRMAKLRTEEFRRVIGAHSIGPREVAAQ